MEDRVISLERRSTDFEERLRLEERMAAEICEERVKEVSDRLVITNERLRVFESTVDELEGFTEQHLRDQSINIEAVDDRVDEVKLGLTEAVEMFNKSIEVTTEEMDDKVDELKLGLAVVVGKVEVVQMFQKALEVTTDEIKSDIETMSLNFERTIGVCEGMHENNSKRIDIVVDWRHEELERFKALEDKMDTFVIWRLQELQRRKTIEDPDFIEEEDGSRLRARLRTVINADHTPLYRLEKLEQRIEEFITIFTEVVGAEVKSEDKESPSAPPMKKQPRREPALNAKYIDLTILDDSPEKEKVETLEETRAEAVKTALDMAPSCWHAQFIRGGDSPVPKSDDEEEEEDSDWDKKRDSLHAKEEVTEAIKANAKIDAAEALAKMRATRESQFATVTTLVANPATPIPKEDQRVVMAEVCKKCHLIECCCEADRLQVLADDAAATAAGLIERDNGKWVKKA